MSTVLNYAWTIAFNALSDSESPGAAGEKEEGTMTLPKKSAEHEFVSKVNAHFFNIISLSVINIIIGLP